MTNDYLAVFLYRSEWSADETLYAASRDVSQHYPSTIIGVATRPVREPIKSQYSRVEFENHVAEVADDVRWFDEPLECEGGEGE